MDKKIGIFYGSTTGTTESVAKKIAKALGVSDTDVYNVASTAPSTVGDYDVLLLGSSTWGSGDLQDDWYDFVAGIEALDLKGKKIALFGCGDETMTDTFCGAVGDLFNRLKSTHADFIGYFDTEGYSFEHSSADVDGNIVGLLIDEVNHPDLTDQRVTRWVEKIKKEI